jgi:maleylpyruvate isomerase
MTERPSWDVLWQWVDDGQQALEAAAASLDEAALQAPTNLDGWTRGHILGHVARNADALGNLLTWARTGVETPMYPSTQARSDGIDTTAGNPLAVQRRDVRESAARLAQAALALPEQRRSFEVRSAQGRPIAALEVPWMRNRELWLHHVDLDMGFTIDDVPAEVAELLVTEVADWMSSRIDATVDLRIEGSGDVVRLGGPGSVTSVISARPQQLAGWLTGRLGSDELRSTGPVPQLPPWL